MSSKVESNGHHHYDAGDHHNGHGYLNGTGRFIENIGELKIQETKIHKLDLFVKSHKYYYMDI